MLKSLLAWHHERYPLMQAQDIVKLVFQAYRGCGHLLGHEDAVIQRIASECAMLFPSSKEPLTEPLGSRYVRLNLRRAMHEGIKYDWIARLMKLSCKDEPCGTVEDVICSVQELDAPEYLNVSAGDISEALHPLEENADWLPSHSTVYHAQYQPAYRVIEKKYAYLLPVLCAASRLSKDRISIAIDGRCGSGKSTLASALSEILDVPVISMDDYFTPHAQKTPERLSLPGGNADIERFCTEIAEPYPKSDTITYRPYDCHMDVLRDPIMVNTGKGMIVEGTYCLHPDAHLPYDIRVFLSVSYEEQCRRILNRDGEWMLGRFVNEWIPLEEAYFDAFALPDANCIVLDQPDHC